MRLGSLVLSLLVALVALFGFVRPAKAVSDPTFRWYTIETEHFRITYHSGVGETAQHVANVCESIHEHMELAMGHSPKQKTELVITDVAESANGSASALPYNAIRLLVTAPEDLSPLGDVDDWYYELITHEHTHVLHTDNIHGIPALVNTVLGKTLAPNQVQPRWILEGYGVYMESARSSAGRLRNSMWDMFMRTDVLENNLASIDQISATVRRWPQGNLFYLYGSYFIAWIAETYGEEALRKMARDYGDNLIPWGINRTARRATGRTFIDLYPDWLAAMQKRYRAQADEARKKGIREGKRLTQHGQVARYPRWIPDNAWPEHKGGLLYYREDQHYRPGLFAIDITRDASGNVTKADAAHADLVARTPSEAYSSFLPDGSLVFNGLEPFRTIFLFGDIEKLEPGKKSPFGTPDGGRIRLTPSKLRASDPATSPDGRRIVFTQNHAGTRTIHIADLEPDEIKNVRDLVPTAHLEQAFTPRWSPDGNFVAYSVWKRGGYRDIRLVDVRDGTFRDITNDRATDGNPAFSADGRLLYFHSDRTGIMNVYAHELATGRTKQVTNVLTGAYSPDPSPDGKTLAYIGYGKKGFDLYAMRIDEASWPDAPPYIDSRPPIPEIKKKRWAVKPYNAWPTLLPRRYGIQITPGNFGQAVILTASGTDITGIHTTTVSTTTEIEKPELQGSASYLYGQLPFDFSVSMFRTITPRGGYAIGQYKPTVIQETTGFSSSIGYIRPTAYDSRAFQVTHSVSRVGAELPVPIDKLDPYETPQFPSRGVASNLHLAMSYTNAERYLWSVGAERGITFNMGFDVTDPVLGSQFAGFATNADLTTYFLMPWLEHHSLALHAGGGTSGGNFPGRGAFFVGGYVDLPVIDTLRDILIQGGVTLRGYPPVALAGRSYTLLNAEYRFPIVNIDRGDQTLPIFLNRINGNVFFDYGSAFDVISDAQFKSGTGAELWSDWTLGYVAPFTFRLGYARGLASLGISKVYFVASVPY